MKQIAICILIFSMSLIFGQEKVLHNTEDNKITKVIIDKMYDYFTATLRENYHTNNEKDLYAEFLSGYVKSWLKIDQNSNVDFFELKDIDNFKSISQDLFVRDSFHYYYFFPELIVLNEEEFKNIEQLRNRVNNKEVVYHYSNRVSENCLPYENYYMVHTVLFSMDHGFTNYLKNGEFETFKFLYNLIEYTGEVPFFKLAAFLTQTEAKSELKHREVREVVTIVFWKLFCLKAGVEFNKPPHGFHLNGIVVTESP